MKQIFSYEGWYYRVFSFAADMIIVSFLFLVPAATIVLIGPALIALYQTIDQLYKEKEIPVWQRYSRTFLANLKRGFILEGIIVGYVAVTAAIIYGLMGITTYLGVFAVILSSLAGLFLTVFVLLFCLFSFSVKQTAQETAYAVLSSTANAIILLVIPVFIFILLNKINFFLFVCLGISGFAYLQVLFFNKVLAKEGDVNESH
ncbi:DUF624 domain-containing protein [Enterococcus sp.]|jgi:hypothetical protein|uniref:DUF624 domain-containing protein n=1 Tax=Enterococcus sp. TaxID=35783 RepID=UPI0025B82DA4|nr:DUF624 domain-containing protein [Enterococcus sp.]